MRMTFRHKNHAFSHFFNKGESLTRLLIKHHSYLKDFPVLTYAMNGALGILYFFPTLCIGNNSEYSSAFFLSVDGEMPRTAAASDVLRKFFIDFSISSKLLFFKQSPAFLRKYFLNLCDEYGIIYLTGISCSTNRKLSIKK